MAYQLLIDDISCIEYWWHSIWSWKEPYRIIIFCWLALENHLLTWDNLRKWGMIGPSFCPLYGLAEETIFHLFVSCRFTQFVWQAIGYMLKSHIAWNNDTLSECFLVWQKKNPQWTFYLATYYERCGIAETNGSLRTSSFVHWTVTTWLVCLWACIYLVLWLLSLCTLVVHFCVWPTLLIHQ